MLCKVLLPLLLAHVVAASGDEEHAFEWAGSFETPAADYAWTMQIVDGAWAND